jgi:hypothetical protein
MRLFVAHRPQSDIRIDLAGQNCMGDFSLTASEWAAMKEDIPIGWPRVKPVPAGATMGVRAGSWPLASEVRHDTFAP